MQYCYAERYLPIEACQPDPIDDWKLKYSHASSEELAFVLELNIYILRKPVIYYFVL